METKTENKSLTLEERLTLLREELKYVWSRDTAYSLSLRSGLHIQTRGQCYVTALLVNELLGGKLITGKVYGEQHFWNEINGKEIDLTSDQYGGDGYTPVMCYDKSHINPKNKDLKRYLKFKERYYTLYGVK